VVDLVRGDCHSHRWSVGGASTVLVVEPTVVLTAIAPSHSGSRTAQFLLDPLSVVALIDIFAVLQLRFERSVRHSIGTTRRGCSMDGQPDTPTSPDADSYSEPMSPELQQLIDRVILPNLIDRILREQASNPPLPVKRIQ
jgi:hypothetical protein